MSDLHQAVQAEIAAHTPALPPSFDALKARKHRRDRRRAVAAVSASALAAAGIAFIPSALGSAGTAPAQTAQDSAPAPAPADGRLPCDSPRMFIYGVSSTTGGAATPVEAAEAFGARPNAESGYAGQTWTQGETKDNGEVQVYGPTARLETIQGSDGTWLVIAGSACPAGAAAADQYGFHVKATDTRAVLADGQQSQDAIKRCMELPGVYNAAVQFSSPGQWTGFIAGRDQAEGFEQCVEAVPHWEATVKAAQEAPPAGQAGGVVWTGVTVCRLAGQGEDDCQFFGETEAAALDDALDTATPAQGDEVYCAALTPTYTVKFNHPSALTAPFTVPLGCGPMQTGDDTYLLPQEARDLVQKTHTDAGTGASAQAFVDRCGGPGADASEYLGKTEAQAQDLATAESGTLRVYGRDGTCLGGTRDLRNDRVNVLLVRDRVIWVRRF